MSSFRNIFFFVTFSVFVAGCADISTQFKQVSEPQEGVPRARLRILANSLVKAVPEKDCIDWSAPGAGTIFGGIVGSSGYRGRSIGMPFKPANTSDFGEMYIAAGKPITLVFLTTPENRYSCSVAGTFVPEKDKDYGAELWLNPSERQCVFRLSQLGETPLPVKVISASACK
ncbi:MAG TPA: hypothetical protein VFP33_06825 [Gallionella sp.]|nr:hypothetical protein [Gallionella sp.]